MFEPSHDDSPLGQNMGEPWADGPPGKLRECSTIFEMKGRKSARRFGTGGRSQPESAREAGCCMHLLSIRRRATSVSTHARLSSSQAEARRLIFPRREPGRGFEQDRGSFFLSRLVE